MRRGGGFLVPSSADLVLLARAALARIAPYRSVLPSWRGVDALRGIHGVGIRMESRDHPWLHREVYQPEISGA